MIFFSYLSHFNHLSCPMSLFVKEASWPICRTLYAHSPYSLPHFAASFTTSLICMPTMPFTVPLRCLIVVHHTALYSCNYTRVPYFVPFILLPTPLFSSLSSALLTTLHASPFTALTNAPTTVPNAKPSTEPTPYQKCYMLRRIVAYD